MMVAIYFNKREMDSDNRPHYPHHACDLPLTPGTLDRLRRGDRALWPVRDSISIIIEMRYARGRQVFVTDSFEAVEKYRGSINNA